MDERTCAVPDCDRPIDRFGARGWCGAHYRRWRRHGDPLGTPKRKSPQCLVTGCSGAANVPGTGRGWCHKHYRAWKLYGDPLATKLGRKTCTIEDCEQLVEGRGYCAKHYSRLIRKGDPLARNRGEVVDGKRICPGCREDKPLMEFSAATGRCKSCVSEGMRDRRSRGLSVTPLRPRFAAICDQCGAPFEGSARQWRFCSRTCLRANVASRSNAARRARVAGAWVESFSRIEIFERDGYVCQICQEPTDAAAAWPDGSIPTIDHITPLVRGGEHSRANVQTAHLTCNLRKGVRLTA